jgi:putative ABC transport system permease protein
MADIRRLAAALTTRRPLGPHFGLMARLAVRDYRHEWVMSGCSILALAAVLIPLLVLFGLKFGIITNLLDPLIENPRYREITPSTSGRYGPDWFETMRARDDVAFVVPRTRAIAASIKLRVPSSPVGRIIDVELIPSAAGDPVLAPDQPAPSGYEHVLLSAEAAQRLGAEPGTRLEGILTRTRRDEQETVRLSFTLNGVTPAASFARAGLFVSPELIVAVEDFLDGRAVPALGWEGSQAGSTERAFAGFRMYARSIDDVAALRSDLQRQGIDVRTSAADIDLVKTLDRNLSIVYWIIALIAVGGYCLSFATSVWANVDRKRREFSVLRLTGFRTGGIVWFPILQAALTGGLAWALACLVYFLAQGTLNSLFAQSIGGGNAVCRLLPWHLLVTLLLTLLAAGLAATAGGRRVAQLEPSLGLRDG